MSGLTTHVLDLVAGAPGCNIAVRLFARSNPDTVVAALATDRDGRARLLEREAMDPGGYRLEFDIGAYFRIESALAPAPAFLETVVIEFSVLPGVTKLHVPLLVSPHGYSTYRGS